MGSGGHARNGPAPDPNALRRDRKDDASWLELPASGRSGPVPDWPLSPAATKRELEIWEREWMRPQAVVWEADSLEVEVAMFVRALRVAEKSDAPVNSRTLVRQFMDSLGLTVSGLLRNRWKIVASTSARPQRASGPGVKDRLRVVQGGEGA